MAQLKLIACSFFMIATASVAGEGPPNVENGLLAADAARVAATLIADERALAPLLGDDLTYGHSSGQVQSKQEYLADIRSGALRYHVLRREEARARSFGCAGVVTAQAATEAVARGQSAAFVLRYTATYVKRGSAWVLVAYQSTRLP